MKYLSYEFTIILHDSLIDKFGGLKGIRDKGLLESALASPMVCVFGEELHKTVFDKAAAYLFGIARNHSFLDGNKRTATAATFAFLRENGKFPNYKKDQMMEFVIEVAKGDMEIPLISDYFEKICH